MKKTRWLSPPTIEGGPPIELPEEPPEGYVPISMFGDRPSLPPPPEISDIPAWQRPEVARVLPATIGGEMPQPSTYFDWEQQVIAEPLASTFLLKPPPFAPPGEFQQPFLEEPYQEARRKPLTLETMDPFGRFLATMFTAPSTYIGPSELAGASRLTKAGVSAAVKAGRRVAPVVERAAPLARELAAGEAGLARVPKKPIKGQPIPEPPIPERPPAEPPRPPGEPPTPREPPGGGGAGTPGQPPGEPPIGEGLLPLGGGLEPPNLPPGGIPSGGTPLPPTPGYKRRVFIPKPIEQVIAATPRGAEVGKAAARVPGVRPVLEVFNPSAVDDTPLRYGIRAHQRQSDVIDNFASNWGQPLRTGADPFAVDNRGLLTNVNITNKVRWKDGLHKMDLRRAYAQGDVALTPKQESYLRVFSDLQDDTTTLAKTEGVLSKKELLDNYSPHIITGRQEGVLERLTGAGRRKLGGRMGFQERRSFPTATAGVVHGGLLYETDFAKAVEQSMRNTLRVIEEKRLADFVRKLPQARVGGKVPLGQARVTAPGLRVTTGYTKTGKPQVKSLVLPTKDVNALAKALDDVGIPQLRPIQQATGIVRFMRTGWDIGVGQIQGLPILFRRPDVWAKAQKASIQALLNPKVKAQWAERNWDGIVEAIEAGVNFSGTEFTELARPLQRIPGLGRGAKHAEASFETFGDVARYYWWQSLKPLSSQSPQMAERVASLVNKGTGWMSFHVSGMPKAMQQFLSIGLFAPRYTASTLALTYGIITGTVPRLEGLKLLGSMLVTAPLAYSAISLAIGQTPELDPRSSKFMTWDLFGHRVGIGGTWVSLARFAGNIARTLEKDPGKLVALEGDNPLVRYARSKEGPYPQVVLDLLTGSNYIGEPVEGWGGLLKELGEAHMPFWASSFVFETQDAIAPLAEMGGFREFPISASEKMATLQERIRPGWEDLSPAEQKALTRTNPELKALSLQAAQDAAERGSDWGRRSVRQSELEDIRDKELLDIAKATQRTGLGENYLKRRGAILQDYYARSSEAWEKYPAKETTDVNEKAFSEYMAVPLEYDAATNEYGFAEQEAAQKALLASFTPEQRAYIDGEKRLWPERFPPEVAQLERQYQQDKPLLTKYYGVADALWDANPRAKQQQDRAAAQRNPQVRAAIRAATPQIAAIEKQIALRRAAMRRSDPKMEKAVLFWTKAVTPIQLKRAG